MSFKIDLHVHTSYSPCSNLSLRTIETVARKRGLDGIAITDHNTIAGSVRAQVPRVTTNGYCGRRD